MKNHLIIISLISIFIYTNLGVAAPQVEVIPSITLSEQYDDNIYLDNDNKETEYLTMLTPGINLNVTSETNIFELRYLPTFVWYYNETYEDIVRHSAGLNFGYDITERTRFGIMGNYSSSDDPIENFEGVVGVRQTRNKYHRGTLNTNISYQFGPENLFTLGYNFGVLENEDNSLDDRQFNNPYANLTYWFNLKNGLEIDYNYTYVEYDSDDEIIAPENYYINSAGARYLRRFQPQTTGSIRYAYTQSFYDDVTERYKIHDVSLGLSHAFSDTFSTDLNVGYSLRDNDGSNDDTISTFDVSFFKTFNRGDFSLGGGSNWRDDFWEADSRGLVRYWSAFVNFNYQLREQLNFYAGANYNIDEDDFDALRQITRSNVGLRQIFLRWFNVSLEYAYITRDDEDDTTDYDVNRVTLSIGVSRPYRL